MYWLSKEVVLGIGMRDGREPDEALVGASSLSSQGLGRKGSPYLGVNLRDRREPNEALVGVGSLSSQGLSRKGSP